MNHCDLFEICDLYFGILHLSFVANMTHTKCPENSIGLMSFLPGFRASVS
ncbi:hypothetical protein D1AOALGA4SA_8261 [Olavius algarvensis Delta 1 endosymbiont]|nr:hypothetical protein D1AOALGA4SA_8261 [Olavius algarvensis Delta 1 endosymbiont]